MRRDLLETGLFTISNDKDKNLSLLVLYLIPESTYNFTCQIQKFHKVFVQNHMKIDMKMQAK